MTDWKQYTSNGDETVENPIFTDESGVFTVVAGWQKNKAEDVAIYEKDDQYWVTYVSGGMGRIAEDFDSEEKAFNFAEELREEY